MSKVEESGSIPKTGRQNPKTEPLPAEDNSDVSMQLDEGEGVMSLEKALVRALQQLGETPENSHPLG